MMAEKETMTTQTTEKRPSLVRSKYWLDSCDFCEAQEEGGHYCLLHSCQLKNANLWTCPECRRCRHRLRTSSDSSPAPCSQICEFLRGHYCKLDYAELCRHSTKTVMRGETKWMCDLSCNPIVNAQNDRPNGAARKD